MSKQRPSRLKESPEFGEYLKALDDHPLSSERLVRNAVEIKERLVAGAFSTAVPKVQGLSKWIKIGTPVVLVLATAGYVLLSSTSEPVLPERDESEAVTSQELAPSGDARIQSIFPAQPPLPPQQKAHVRAESRARTRKINGQPRIETPKAESEQVTAQLASRKPEHSDLPEQLRLYQEAKRDGKRGDFDTALARLRHLFERFPKTPLRADAELSRVEYLVKAGRTAQAIPFVEALLALPEHTGRYGELYRLLGDLYRIKGDCDRAKAAYQQALRFQLKAHDEQAVQQGLSRCEDE